MKIERHAERPFVELSCRVRLSSAVAACALQPWSLPCRSLKPPSGNSSHALRLPGPRLPSRPRLVDVPVPWPLETGRCPWPNRRSKRGRKSSSSRKTPSDVRSMELEPAEAVVAVTPEPVEETPTPPTATSCALVVARLAPGHDQWPLGSAAPLPVDSVPGAR